VSEASFEERLEATLDAKRALFAAAMGDDTETTTLERSTLASRIATLMRAEFAASTGPARGVTAEEAGGAGAEVTAEEAEAPPKSGVELIRERLGDALERVVRLPDGRLLGVVRGSAAEVPSAYVPAVLLPKAAADALAPLGEASPLAQGEVLYRAEEAPAADPRREARRALLAAADRKVRAAGALTAAGLGGEALGMLREALALGCRAAAQDGDPGDDPAPLLGAVYARLLPQGAVTEADANALARAAELARVFGGAAAVPPEGVVAGVEREARDLLGRVREVLSGA
jgi:hypothetical protein